MHTDKQIYLLLGEMTPLEQTRAYREIVAKNQPHESFNPKHGLRVKVPADLCL